MTRIRKIALIALILATCFYALARAHTADANTFRSSRPTSTATHHIAPITQTDLRAMNRAARSMRRYCAQTAHAPAMISIDLDDLDDHEITARCLTLP